MGINRIPRDFILNELQRSDKIKVTSNQAQMCCPFHKWTNPYSLGVRLTDGKVKAGTWSCFGCKAGGNWNELALRLGLKSWDLGTDNDYIPTLATLDKFELISEDSLTLDKFDLKWKSYNTDFLECFNAKKLWHDKYKEYYLYLPITYLYDRYGFVQAKLNPNSYGPKYWFNFQSKIPYPFDLYLDKDISVLVLVEGIADAYRLIRANIPALAILGSSITEFGFDLIDIINPKLIVIMLDNDDAGLRAINGFKNKDGFKNGIKALLKDRGYDVKVCYPPKGHDPDSMSFKNLLKFRNYIISLGANPIHWNNNVR